MIDSIDSIYIPRGGSEEARAKALAAIRDRQELIEETGKYAPFLIFAEGGTSNGSHIIKFKKGAFFAEKTIRPIVLKYKSKTYSPAFDTMEMLPLVILHLCWACFKCEVNVLPDFQPNEYLFENFADKGAERWEIYSWAVREVMLKTGGMKPCDVPLRHKMLYEAYMQMQPDAPDPAQVINNMTLLQNNELQISPTGDGPSGKDDESGKFLSLPNGDEQEM